MSRVVRYSIYTLLACAAVGIVGAGLGWSVGGALTLLGSQTALGYYTGFLAGIAAALPTMLTSMWLEIKTSKDHPSTTAKIAPLIWAGYTLGMGMFLPAGTLSFIAGASTAGLVIWNALGARLMGPDR